MDEETVQAVRERVDAECEYCRLPEAFHPGPFEIEHVIPVQHGGTDALGNLAYACLRCNRHKGPNLAGIDRQTSRTRLVRLFNPGDTRGVTTSGGTARGSSAARPSAA